MSGISAQPRRQRGPLDHVLQTAIDWTVVPMAKAITLMAEHGFLFLTFAVLWLAFAVGMLANPGSLDSAWAWIRGLPLIAQGVLWVLFLPVVVGLWVWEAGWPMLARLLIVVSLAGWNLLMFLPRAPRAPRASQE